MTEDRRHFWSHTFPLWAYALVVLVACSVPIAVPRQGGLWTDKSDHFVAFLIFEILAARALQDRALRSGAPSRLRRHGLAIAISALFGALLEGWQGLLPWRSMELLDWVADVLGALLGAAIHCAVLRSCKPTRAEQS
jgi:VanZ family protein